MEGKEGQNSSERANADKGKKGEGSQNLRSLAHGGRGKHGGVIGRLVAKKKKGVHLYTNVNEQWRTYGEEAVFHLQWRREKNLSENGGPLDKTLTVR